MTMPLVCMYKYDCFLTINMSTSHPHRYQQQTLPTITNNVNTYMTSELVRVVSEQGIDEVRVIRVHGAVVKQGDHATHVLVDGDVQLVF